jgi:16S rRNA (adenine1518-N6/adenine1519-N6)-dimethyltransferase
MKAKKSYGQHFLKEERIAQRVADSLQLTDQYQDVLEVGPGRGMLTRHLLGRSYTLTAVEADHELAPFLKKHFPELKDRIIFGDFLRIPLEKIFPERPFALIGNFPYNISSQIVFKMLRFREQVPELVGMFQLEMAERIIAPPGSKTYGVISVLTQAYYRGEILFKVGRDAFQPPPKVESAVIRLERLENCELGCDYHDFRKVVKQAFSMRRKMLRNTMKTFIKGDPLLDDAFFNQRPEQLSVDDFVDLTLKIVERVKKNGEHHS